MKNKATPLTDKFIHDLKEKLSRGKIQHVKVAKDLSITKHLLSKWLHRKRNPNGEHTLRLQCWLKDNLL